MAELKTSDIIYILDLLQEQKILTVIDRDSAYREINNILEEEYTEE